jgi:phosphoribosylamine--glycine ligase
MKVLVVMGSDSDLSVMQESADLLKEFGIAYELTVASAHRSPERALRLASGAEKAGVEVIIAGAGMAAHLAGVMASQTIVPVIGVPINASPLNGLDALLSTVQMPPGVPVATVSIGRAGARNAAVLAAEIIGRKEKSVARKLRAFRRRMAAEVQRKALALEGPSGKQ